MVSFPRRHLLAASAALARSPAGGSLSGPT